MLDEPDRVSEIERDCSEVLAKMRETHQDVIRHFVE
jgi:hypothetical protein